MSQRDVNGQTVSYRYDGLGRLVRTDFSRWWLGTDCLSSMDQLVEQFIERRRGVQVRVENWSREYFDGWGDVYKSEQRSESHEPIVIRTEVLASDWRSWSLTYTSTAHYDSEIEEAYWVRKTLDHKRRPVRVDRISELSESSLENLSSQTPMTYQGISPFAVARRMFRSGTNAASIDADGLFLVRGISAGLIINLMCVVGSPRSSTRRAVRPPMTMTSLLG